MITPKQIDDMGWRMAEVYGAVTDQILINMARHFRRVASEGKMNGSFEWQAQKLAELGQVTRESAKIIQSMLGDADMTLRLLLERTIMEALKDVDPKLKDAASRGLLMNAAQTVAPNQMQAFQAYYQQSADKLNLVNTVMLESTQQAYAATVTDIGARIARTQGILNAATGEVVTGASSYDAAIKNGLAKMVANGLTGFVDHAGRRWSPEAYVAMDVRTTVANTARASIWERNNDYGNDLYKVSWHNGARPLCYPWQSKVISRTDNVRDVTDLDENTVHVYAQSETTYGQAAGLFGVNCKHLPLTFIPGLSTIDEPQQDEEENAKAYAISQEQRALERKLRYDKRDLEILKASGAPEEEIKAARAKVRQSSADIDAFCDKNNVPRRRNRERAAINATFPPTDSYDPADFDTTQRDQMREFFTGDRGTPPPDDNPTNNAPVSPNVPPNNPPPQAQTTAPQQAPETVNETPTRQLFTPAKTKEEAEQYARDHFANAVDYNGISLANANEINKTLSILESKYPINKLEVIGQQQMRAVARANAFHLTINGKGLGKILNDETKYFKENQEITRKNIEWTKSRYADKPKIPWDVQRKLEKMENSLKFSRYGVHSSYENHVQVTITHEYGHILSDQYFGMLNNEQANPHYATNWQLRTLTDKWKSAFDKAHETGDIYKLSQYGASDYKEFFAESFAAREMGEKLPDYVENLFVEVFKNGIM